MSCLGRDLYIKIKSLYEQNPRRFKARCNGAAFSLTDRQTGEVFKGHHSEGVYIYDEDGKLEFVQEWHGPFFCTTEEVKEMYEIVSRRREDRCRKLWKMKLEKLQNKKLTDLKSVYEG